MMIDILVCFYLSFRFREWWVQQWRAPGRHQASNDLKTFLQTWHLTLEIKVSTNISLKPGNGLQGNLHGELGPNCVNLQLWKGIGVLQKRFITCFFSIFVFVSGSDDLSNGGLLADTSKQCPDKLSVKYVNFIFVKFSEKGIFYAFQPKFEKPPSKYFFLRSRQSNQRFQYSKSFS